jgi:exopolysaccharide biosynthesis protein
MSNMKKYALWMMLICCALLLAGCVEKAPAQAAATATETPETAAPETAAPTDVPTPTPTVEVVEIVLTPAPTPSPTATPEPTDTPAPTDTPVPTATPTPDCLHGGDHPAEVFAAGEPVKTETTYASENVSIRIERIEDPEGFPKPMVCFVADIYIEDITSLRSAWSRDTLSASANNPMDVLELMAREDALLMINGDYISKWNFGCVVTNGVVARQVDNPRYDACVLLRDGTMLTLDGNKTSSEQILAMDPWQAWCFGPALLDENGKAKDTFNSSLTDANPRTALGYYAPGHYCFVVVDGRWLDYSYGMTLQKLSRFMASLGCAAAYNLDGGSSSVMAFDGRRVSNPPFFRNIPDVIYICEPRKEN